MAAAKPLPTVPDSPVSRPPLSVGVPPISPRDELARSLSPLIAVVASPDAESLCQANNIPSFADYIRPFGEYVEGRVSPRDWQGVPIPIDNFKVRFRDINKLDEPNHQAMMSLVDDYVRSNAVEQVEPLIKTAADVNDAYLDKSIDELAPWYTYFRKMMLSLRGITEHETFDHPVAVFIVVTSSDPDPMSTTTQLYNPNIPSFTVDKPYIDPNILRYHIILHDPQRATEEQAQITFEKMRRTLGLNCHLLRINSKPRPAEDLLGDQEIQTHDDDNDESISNIWRDMLNEAYVIDSKLAAYANNAASATGEYFGASPHSPAQSSHTRSSSVSSNVSSLQGATAVHAANFQATPLDASLESLEPRGGAAGGGGGSPQVEVFADNNTPPPVQYGKCLTVDDIRAAKAMVREFVVQSLIPFMERNIQLWNEQVASARRGLTGRLFGASRRLFGSSSRSPSNQSLTTIPASGPNLPTGVNQMTVYPFGAPEAQMRKLADYAFMIRDYKFAHTIYDTVRRDYATDKAYKYHAGTQEMIGICLLMMNQPLRSKIDADRNFELAVQQYLGRCRTPFHATRTTVIYYELLKAHRMWKEVPTALVRMTGEDSDLRSALFLEQAAHCFLRVPRPLVRKYGFHVVMAAHRYGKASQRKHAFRCYKMASLIYEDHGWSIATSHIQFALGRQAFHLGRLEDAVLAFANMLANDKQTPQQQVAHVREFLFIYRQYTSQAGIDPRKESLPKLALPVIDSKSIRVQLSNAQPQQDNEDDWQAMERELLEENIATGIIYGSKKTLALQQQSDNRAVCAIGEPATVSLELYNPLQIPISFNDIILGCEYRDSMKPFKGSRDPEVEAYEQMIEGNPIEGTNRIDFGHFELEKLAELTLEPLERRVVNLSLLPKSEGSILVKGLHYTFNNLVHSFRPMIKKGKRLNDTLDQRQSVVYGEDYTLDILVTSPMPLLDLTFHGVPESMLSGEVVQTVLEINNKGNKGLTALRMKSSHPSFLCVGRPEEMDKSIYGSENDDKEDEKTYQLDNKLYDPSVISIPLPGAGGDGERGVVAPGMTTLIPLWIRGDRIGRHTIKLLFSYQSEQDNPAIAHRTLRYSIHVQVLPSLKINAFTRPSAATPNEYILGIEIENLQTVAGFQLTQITAASPKWTIVPLSIQMQSTSDITSKTNIPPRQTTFSYYKLRKISNDGSTRHQQDDDSETPPMDLHISKLAFGPAGIPFDTVPLKVFAMNSRMQWRYGQLQTQHPGVSALEYGNNNNFALYSPGDVDLSLYWDIPNMKRHGHHYIIGINLTENTLPAPTVRRGSAVGGQPHLPVPAA